MTDFESGLKCVLHGKAVPDMNKNELIAFVGFLDEHIVSLMCGDEAQGFRSKKDEQDKVSHEVVVIADHFISPLEYAVNIRYQWRNVDVRGNLLAKSFYGMSVDDGPYIDVESVVKRWENRNNITKPAYRKVKVKSHE